MEYKIKEVGGWHDSLIMCPSQCHLNLKSDRGFYTVYLRWRHSDPWAADLVKTKGSFGMGEYGLSWTPLPVDFFTHNQLARIKENALHLAKKALILQDAVSGEGIVEDSLVLEIVSEKLQKEEKVIIHCCVDSEYWEEFFKSQGFGVEVYPQVSMGRVTGYHTLALFEV